MTAVESFFFLNRHPELKKQPEGIEQLKFLRTREGFRQCAAKDLPFRFNRRHGRAAQPTVNADPSRREWCVIRCTRIIAYRSVCSITTAQDDGR